MRRIAIFLAVLIWAAMSWPASAQATGSKSAISAKLQEVDSRLQRVFHDLRTAAEFVYKNQSGNAESAYQALQILAESERKVDQALSMIRAMKPKAADAALPSKEQLGNVERVAGEAAKLIRDVRPKVDAALKHKPEDAKRAALMLKLADSHAAAALKMLQEIKASL